MPYHENHFYKVKKGVCNVSNVSKYIVLHWNSSSL